MSQHVWFVDRCLGKVAVAAELRGAGAKVEVHDDHFPQNALDEDWLLQVGARGWLLITKDERITRNSAERLALTGAGVGAFIVNIKDITGPDLGKLLVSILPAMSRRADQLTRPFIVTISAGGNLNIKIGERRSGRRK